MEGFKAAVAGLALAAGCTPENEFTTIETEPTDQTVDWTGPGTGPGTGTGTGTCEASIAFIDGEVRSTMLFDEDLEDTYCLDAACETVRAEKNAAYEDAALDSVMEHLGIISPDFDLYQLGCYSPATFESNSNTEGTYNYAGNDYPSEDIVRTFVIGDEFSPIFVYTTSTGITLDGGEPYIGVAHVTDVYNPDGQTLAVQSSVIDSGFEVEVNGVVYPFTHEEIGTVYKFLENAH